MAARRDFSLLAVVTVSLVFSIAAVSLAFGSTRVQADTPTPEAPGSPAPDQLTPRIYMPSVANDWLPATDPPSVPAESTPEPEPEPAGPLPDPWLEPTPTAQLPDVAAPDEVDLSIPIDVTPAAETPGYGGEFAPDIVGGRDANSGQFPWQVLLQFKRSGVQYMCGGILIDPLWVLTAAHCTAGSSDFTVTLGELRRDRSDGTEQTRSVRRIVSHPSYDAGTKNNDIALLELNQPVILTSSVRPIPLVASPANDNVVTPGTNATISGWGRTSESGSATNRLQYATIPIVSQSECRRAMSGYTITDNMLCAGPSGGGTDTCQGDSGGPLVVPESGEWRVAGVTSWGVGCARSGRYGVYTRVSRYVNWINGYVHPAALRGSFRLVPLSVSSRCLDIQGGTASTGNGANAQIWDCWGTQATNQLWKLVRVGSYYQIRAIHSEKCLDVERGATANGANVHQWGCVGASQTNQLWRFNKISNGYQIIAVHSGKCLDVARGATGNGSNVHQWQCTGASQTNQIWQIIPMGDFQLVAQHSNKCVDVAGGTNAFQNGTNVHQWRCIGSTQTNQLWRPIHVGSNNYQLMAVHSGKCLDVAGGTGATSNGTNVHQWNCVGTNQTNQLWSFVPLGNTFQVVARHSGKCLDVAGGTRASADGTNVQQWGCIGASQTNQRWYLK